MKYKNRLLEEKLTLAAKHFPVIALTGGRQVGKTTLITHLLHEFYAKASSADAAGDRKKEEEFIYTFDPVVDVANARREPELLLNHVSKPVLFDEIQYAPELLPVIKRMVDANKMPGQYWLTGSQNLSVLKTVAESLAGRVALLTLSPMSLGETQNQPSDWIVRFLQDPQSFIKGKSQRIFENKRTSVFSILWRGGYPGLFAEDDAILQIGLDSFFKTYIERDIRVLGDISDLHEFSRFTQLIANLTAQEINYSQLGREIGITPQTAKRWLDILINTFQWHELPSYSGNAIKRLSSKPKGYFIDTAMACHLMYITSENALASHPRLGALFETFVVQDLLKQIETMSTKPAVYHWRSHSGAELDLLFEINNRFYPIEIKCKSQITSSDMSGIKAFRETYPKLDIAPALIIAPIKQILPLAKDCYAVPYDLV